MGDTNEYRRYWQELMESSPGMWYSCHSSNESVPAVLLLMILLLFFIHKDIARRFAKFRPEDFAKHLGDQAARNSDDIRSQLEEMERLNNEEMRDLNRCVPMATVSAAVCVSATVGYV